MRKLKVNAMQKTSAERNLEAKEMLQSLMKQLSESLRTVNYLRNNFEDVLDLNKVRNLYEMSKEIEKLHLKFFIEFIGFFRGGRNH